MCLLHRAQGGGLVVEFERAGPPVELSRHVGATLGRIVACSTMRALCDESARVYKELTGYDRVMVYRFDDDGHGEVFAEVHEPGLEPYLGNRYPASDIPQIARRLYERNRVRLLADVAYTPVALAPRLSPITGRDLDMSLCCLRSMSPIHIQYLKNMGVAATLVASLMVGGRLWGLIACHHYRPRFVHYEIRAVCELLAETIATRIAALESFAQAQADLSVRRLEQRMIEAISRDGDWRTALFDNSQALLQTFDATGAALLFEGQVLTAGEVPGTLQLQGDRPLARSPTAQPGGGHGLASASTNRRSRRSPPSPADSSPRRSPIAQASISCGSARNASGPLPGAAIPSNRSCSAMILRNCRRAARSPSGIRSSREPRTPGHRPISGRRD